MKTGVSTTPWLQRQAAAARLAFGGEQFELQHAVVVGVDRRARASSIASP